MRTPTSSNAYYPLFFFCRLYLYLHSIYSQDSTSGGFLKKKLKHKNNAALTTVTECSLRVAVAGRLTLRTIPIQNEVLHNVLLHGSIFISDGSQSMFPTSKSNINART